MYDGSVGIYLIIFQVPMEEMHVELLSGCEPGRYERVSALFIQPSDRVFVGPVRAMVPAPLL